jgi:hypothetical protein
MDFAGLVAEQKFASSEAARRFRGKAETPREGEPTQDIARDLLTGTTNGTNSSLARKGRLLDFFF